MLPFIKAKWSSVNLQKAGNKYLYLKFEEAMSLAPKVNSRHKGQNKKGLNLGFYTHSPKLILSIQLL